MILNSNWKKNGRKIRGLLFLAEWMH